MGIDEVRRIAVIGSGTMGGGIAQVAAMAGYLVAMEDISEAFLEKAVERIDWSLSRLVARGRLSRGAAEEALSRIRTTLMLRDAVRDADLVIEAVPERIDLKKRVFREVDESAPRQAVLASNTSSLRITEIAAATGRPEKVVGMHFFNPPQIMKLVEIVPGEETAEETVEVVRRVAAAMGKTPVVARRDRPGFIVNRVLMPYLNEAARLVSAGEASVEEVDSAMRFKANFPVGPFQLMDLIGLDIVYGILKVLEEELGPHYRPQPPIAQLFEAGRLGRKTGMGFYDYPEGKAPAIAEEVGKAFDEKRLLAIMINEAARVVEEGVSEPGDVDMAIRLGLNLPEGPFEMLRRWGREPVIEVLRGLEEKLGRAYAPSPTLTHTP